jgi:hypothetical protein
VQNFCANAPKNKIGRGIIKLYQSRSYHFHILPVYFKAIFYGIGTEHFALGIDAGTFPCAIIVF